MPEQLAGSMRAAIVAELHVRHLDEPDALATALGVLPATAAGLLARPEWSQETSRLLISRLDLPLEPPADPSRMCRPCLADVVGL